MGTKKIVAFNFRNPNPDKSGVIFPVETQPFIFQNKKSETEISGDRGVAVVRSDTKRIICSASSDYQLQPHKKILDSVEKMFKTNKIKFKLFDIRTGGVRGNRMYANYILPSYNFKVGKDTYTPFLQVQNSYDKSLLFNLATGIYRLACTNGLVFTKNLKFMSKKHTHENIDLTEVELTIEDWVKNISIVQENLEELRKRKLTKKLIEEIPTKVFNRKRDIEGFKELKLVKKYVDELGNNEYALFNALTEYTSHVLDSLNENHDYTRLAQKKIAKVFFSTIKN